MFNFGMFRQKEPAQQPDSALNLSFKVLVAAADQPTFCDTNVFLTTALFEAKDAKVAQRQTILSDIAGLLSCTAEELDFMFNIPVIAANDSDPVTMPDFRLTLRDDLRVNAG